MYTVLYTCTTLIIPISAVCTAPLLPGFIIWVPIVLAFLWCISIDRVTTRAFGFPRILFDDISSGSVEVNTVVLGGGWSAFLSRRMFSGRVVSSAQHTGEVSMNLWKSGTRIREVQRALSKRGQTLAGTPSISEATIGGWLFTNSHGSGGELWTPAFGDVTVYNTHSHQLEVGKKKDFFSDAKSVDDQRRYVVMQASVLPVEDVVCHRHAFDICDLEASRRFFDPSTYLRMVFVDSRQALAYTWTPSRDDKPQVRNSRIYPWLVVIMPTFLSRRVPRALMETSEHLSIANDFAPTPPLWTGVFSFAYVNFELFIKYTLTPESLLHITTSLRNLFKSGVRGRCEIRYGRDKLFLDFAVRVSDPADYTKIFDCVQKNIGRPFTFHKGKFTPEKYLRSEI